MAIKIGINGFGRIGRMVFRAVAKDFPEFEIVAIKRREHVLLPHLDTLLEPQDRLLMIAGPEARDALRQYLTPVNEAEGKGMQAPGGETAT